MQQDDVMKSATEQRRVSKLLGTHSAVRMSTDHRKHSRWLNNVMAISRAAIRANGLTVSTPEQHAQHMRRLRNRKTIR